MTLSPKPTTSETDGDADYCLRCGYHFEVHDTARTQFITEGCAGAWGTPLPNHTVQPLDISES